VTDVTDVTDDAPATKGDLKGLATKQDLRELETRLEAKLEEKLSTKLDTAVFEAAQRELIELIARAASATQDEMRRWFNLLLEKHDSDVSATNTNVAQLREDFEAHRDDTKVHVTRTPRRRSRG
jgi:uncharacterized protein (DUF1697 family)